MNFLLQMLLLCVLTRESILKDFEVDSKDIFQIKQEPKEEPLFDFQLEKGNIIEEQEESTAENKPTIKESFIKGKVCYKEDCIDVKKEDINNDFSVEENPKKKIKYEKEFDIAKTSSILDPKQSFILNNVLAVNNVMKAKTENAILLTEDNLNELMYCCKFSKRIKCFGEIKLLHDICRIFLESIMRYFELSVINRVENLKCKNIEYISLMLFDNLKNVLTIKNSPKKFQVTCFPIVDKEIMNRAEGMVAYLSILYKTSYFLISLDNNGRYIERIANYDYLVYLLLKEIKETRKEIKYLNIVLFLVFYKRKNESDVSINSMDDSYKNKFISKILILLKLAKLASERVEKEISLKRINNTIEHIILFVSHKLITKKMRKYFTKLCNTMDADAINDPIINELSYFLFYVLNQNEKLINFLGHSYKKKITFSNVYDQLNVCYLRMGIDLLNSIKDFVTSNIVD
ncbi:hypothetical protein NGRA_1556 [Nosema granulosis]|uniref:Uncharacterized protein n=1 Tax=Nosema granulosis TaxID=83296 RepID=A0A9P6GY85_9MICR|nr:hypothetical protein NGRA_1556 [Nosema granulosis]